MINWPVQIQNSKYSRWYEQLINKAKNRVLPSDSYYESHHIIPRSFKTDNCNHKDNLINLTAREHYIAHALLWRMKFPGLYGKKMAYAFNTFIRKFKTKDHQTYNVNSRIYESFRIKYAQMLSESMQGEKNHYYGKKHSEETRRIIGEKSKLKEFKRGPENPNWGKTPNISPEGKQRRIDAIKQRWQDPDFKAQQSAKKQEFYKTPEGIAYRQAISDRSKGKKRDPAVMEKCAAAKRGKKWEEIYSPETIEKMRCAIKNRVISDDAKQRIAAGRAKGCRMSKSDEWKRKMSERMKTLKQEKIVCTHCGKACSPTNHKRWHGDNCKLNIQKGEFKML